MVACHRRGRRPAASEAHTELCVCVSECERGKREGRAEGGGGEQEEDRTGERKERKRIRSRGKSAGKPSGWAVFSVQPRNDRLKFLVLRLGKKNASPPHNHIDHAQYFPNKTKKKKKIRRTNFTHKYRHTINSLESQQQQSVSSAARRPRARRPRHPPSTSGENILSRGSGVSRFRTCW